MTKGNREARMKARMERQMLDNGPVRGKRQFVRKIKMAENILEKMFLMLAN